MLFAKPNVIDPNPTRNLHSRILFFLFGPNTGQLFAPPNLWFLHMMDTEIKKIGDPKKFVTFRYQPDPSQSLRRCCHMVPGFFLASGLCRCEAAIPLQPFRPLGAILTTFALGYKELMCVTLWFLRVISRLHWHQSLSLFGQESGERNQISFDCSFLHSCPMTTAGNLFYTT